MEAVKRVLVFIAMVLLGLLAFLVALLFGGLPFQVDIHTSPTPTTVVVTQDPHFVQ